MLKVVTKERDTRVKKYAFVNKGRNEWGNQQRSGVERKRRKRGSCVKKYIKLRRKGENYDSVNELKKDKEHENNADGQARRKGKGREKK